MQKPPIVFIHGLWLLPSSWWQWEKYFNSLGYSTLSLSWPGDSTTVEEARQHPERIAGIGMKQIADACAAQIAELGEPPIVIGHSFGGLVAQELLGRGIGSAAIAIDPAPIKGVRSSPPSVLRSFLPFLINPFNIHRAVLLSPGQFRYGFANEVTEDTAKELYDRYVVPAPAKPLFEVLVATFGPGQAKAVNTTASRGPLLVIGGEKDHNAPPVFGQSTVRQYRGDSITEYHEFANRGHALIIDDGWEEIASYCAAWLGRG